MCLVAASAEGAPAELQRRLAEHAAREGSKATAATQVAVGGTAMGSVDHTARLNFSGRHDGLCRVAARLLARVWDAKLMVATPGLRADGADATALRRPKAFWVALHPFIM